MQKRKVLFLVLLFCLLGGAYSLFSKQTETLSNPCSFCNETILTHQKFYEDDLVLALYTHKPIFPGHCLIIPKRHVERFEMLSDAEMTQMGKVIQKVNFAVMEVFDTSSYLLLQKNGREVAQIVPHVHFHYVPRKTGDSSIFKYILKMFIANAKKPIESVQMDEIVEKMKIAMDET